LFLTRPKKVRGQGCGVGCVEMDGKLARDVAATLFAWMHQERLLVCLPDGYGKFQLRFFSAGDGGSQVLAWALQRGSKKKKDAEWTSVNACSCAKETGLSVGAVHKELERLSKAKLIGYKLTDRSFFFEASPVLAGWNDGDLMRHTTVMHQRLQQLEDIGARKSRDLYNILRQQNVPFKDLLNRYFETGGLDNDKRVEDAAARCFVRARDDRMARGDVATLLNSITLTSGKEVARIMHGIRGSEGSDALISSRFWGKGRHLEYRSLVELANEIILKRNAFTKDKE
jgi:hypothetical protein